MYIYIYMYVYIYMYTYIMPTSRSAAKLVMMILMQ